MRFALIITLPVVVLLSVLSASDMFAQKGTTTHYVQDSLGHAWGDCDGTPCVTLRVRYPRFTKHGTTRDRDSLNVFIQETLLGKYDPRGVAPVLLAVLDTLAAQHRALPAGQSGIPWVIERSIDVVGDTLGILTLDVQEFRSTGAAHPVTMHLFYMVDPSTMGMLTLEDLVFQEKRTSLARLAENAFRTVRRVPQGGDLAKAGFTFPEGKFALTMNVGLTHDGLVFYYNPYEIAPEDVGPTEVTVSWKDLNGMFSWKKHSP